MSIAVIGLSGRFPGATNLRDFWQNLVAGKDVRRDFGVDAPPFLRDAPEGTHIVRKGYVLDAIDHFDAPFFAMTPREAAITDPQHRLLLECAYAALEDAGYVDERSGTIGVFASANFNSYLFQASTDAHYADIAKHLEMVVGNDKDYLASRISYKLGLTGPSLTVQTACSSSLVALCQAAQALLSYQCDFALVGGVGARALQETGYFVRPGDGVLSEDGQVRPFDARATGFMEGSGVGAVVLRRLDDALSARDTVRAVVRGFAVNNDGASKVSFTAPSVSGQAQVIAEAVAMSDVDPATISYVEAHGTGTPLGDPIEAEALGRTYGAAAGALCRLGSVKSSIGHLDAAAGVAGFIKAVLALEHRYLPGTLNFEQPNPRARLPELGFTVSAVGEPWRPLAPTTPLRAAVSSLGIGGTNAHVVLEQGPPVATVRGEATGNELLVLSARSAQACQQAAHELAERLNASPVRLDDVAHTLRAGRRAFAHRRCVVASDAPDAARGLLDPARYLEASLREHPEPPSLAFLFPGAGRQHAGMGEALYRAEPDYRAAIDECAEHTHALCKLDLTALLYGDKDESGGRWHDLSDASGGLLALFATELALARLFIGRGFAPSCALGHSVGEYVAAQLSGVFSVRRALQIIALRGQVFTHLPAGGMLAVALSEVQTRAVLRDGLALAAVNGPQACVISGERAAVDAIERELRGREVTVQRLAVSVAGHHPMLAPHVGELRACLHSEQLSPPELPFISSLSGTWITAAQAMDPEYWVSQLLSTVRFRQGVECLLESASRLVLQLGPGKGMLSLVRDRCDATRAQSVVACLPEEEARESAHRVALEAMGRSWLAGVELDAHLAAWARDASRISLPSYPFQRTRHWLAAESRKQPSEQPPAARGVTGWVPSWQRGAAQRFEPEQLRAQRWWVLLDNKEGVGPRMVEALEGVGADVLALREEGSAAGGPTSEMLRTRNAAAWQALLQRTLPGALPDLIVLADTLKRLHVDAQDPSCPREATLLALAQACSRLGLQHDMRVVVLTEGLLRVVGDELLDPGAAMVLGAARTLPHEQPQLDCLHVDLMRGRPTSDADVRTLLMALASPRTDQHVPSLALRHGELWHSCFEPYDATTAVPDLAPLLRDDGSYLITGGFGGIGRTLARALASARKGLRLALVSRPQQTPKAEVEVSREALQRELGALGAQVRCYEADVANEAELRVVVESVCIWAPLRGVVHAAGVIGGGLLALRQETAGEGNLEPKVHGLQGLARLLKNEPLDFFCLCSSLGAYTGAFGQGDNVAANLFFDSFAQARAAEARALGLPICVRSIGWDYWLDVGMMPRLAEAHRAIAGEDLREGLTPEQGAAWFARALSADTPQLLVAARDFPSLLKTNREQRGQARALFEAARASTQASSRPALMTPYVEPVDSLERCIAEVWERALGVHPIGRHDDFRELGGQSLSALPLVASLRDLLRVKLSLRDFFVSADVKGLALHLRAQESVRGQADAIADALLSVRALADDELERALSSSPCSQEAKHDL